MFEQNNVGVQLKTPLANYVETLLESSAAAPAAAVAAAAAYLVDATERILDNIEGMWFLVPTMMKLILRCHQ
jgi:hypothetical protein